MYLLKNRKSDEKSYIFSLCKILFKIDSANLINFISLTNIQNKYINISSQVGFENDMYTLF